MSVPLDDRLDQLLRDWVAESMPDSSRRAALRGRILAACHEELAAESSAKIRKRVSLAPESVGAVGDGAKHQRPSVSWPVIGTLAVASAAVLMIGIALAWWMLKQDNGRQVAQDEPASASGSVMSDVVSNESVADADVASEAHEAGPSAPGPPAAEALPPPAVEAEMPQAEVEEVGAEAPAGFTEVKIESLPKGWGFAHRTLTSDGKIRGGHLSGDPEAVRVFESEEQCKAKDMEEIRSLVSRIRASQEAEERDQPDRSPQIDRDKHGYTRISITYKDGKAFSFVAKRDEKHEDADVQAVRDILSRYDAGAW